jgi:hypothetical protein
MGTELTKLESEDDRRERLNQYTESDSFLWDDDLSEGEEANPPSAYCNVESELENRVEYSIYNSTGYVTFTTNLKEARTIAIQFAGYVVDELGNRI